MARIALMVFGLILWGAFPAFAAQGANPSAPSRSSVQDLNAFFVAYDEEVFNDLKQIHAHEMTPNGRYLILQARQGGYVQCLFHDDDTMIYCEAASGYYWPELRLALKPDALAAIAAQGFTMDGSKGNFKLDRPVAGDVTLWDTANRMLEALYRAYGAGMGDVTIVSPIIQKNE